MASLPSSERTEMGGAGDAATIRLRNDTVADMRAIEMMQLLGAYGALHREGMLDVEEYEAKRLVLAERAACQRRLPQL